MIPAEYVGASVIDHLMVESPNSEVPGKLRVVPADHEFSFFVSKDLRLTVGAALAESTNSQGKSVLNIIVLCGFRNVLYMITGHQ